MQGSAFGSMVLGVPCLEPTSLNQAHVQRHNMGTITRESAGVTPDGGEAHLSSPTYQDLVTSSSPQQQAIYGAIVHAAPETLTPEREREL